MNAAVARSTPPLEAASGPAVGEPDPVADPVAEPATDPAAAPAAGPANAGAGAPPGRKRSEAVRWSRGELSWSEG